MDSRKRSRTFGDIGDGELFENGFSQLDRGIPRKRSRLAMAAARGGSVVSDESDGDDEDMYLEASQSVGSDDEINNRAITNDRQSQSLDSDDEDEEEQERGVQAIRDRNVHNVENVAAEEGVIEEVFCRNFMCHSKLRIKLGPLINFIIGHNGSGKSAVLTALTMCLGGKATSTNRGASLKSLIKEGQDSAMLAVKIRNRGEGAYKPQLYGNYITVERHFSRSGTSAFKIKNSEDKVITIRKADLDDICDFFAFQLDNPINVLNQDMARQFLANSTAAEKYKFFIRGTQLETLDTDYRLMEEHVDNIGSKLHARQGDIDNLKAKAMEAESKRKRLQEAGALQEKIEQCKRMHAWAQVAEQESLLANIEAEVQNAEQRIAEREQIALDKSATYDGRDQSFIAAGNQVTLLSEQLQPAKDDRDNAKNDFDDNKKKLQDSQIEQRHMKDNRAAVKSRITTLEEQARIERKRLEEMEGAEHGDRLRVLDDLKEAYEEAKTAYESCGTEQTLLQQQTKTVEDDGKAKEESARKRELLETAEKQLAVVEKSESRPFDGYDSRMSNLVRAVQQETRWREKPVGPIGAHIRLANLDWQPQLEKMLNELLPGFVVTNAADKDLLMQIMRRIGYVPNIYTTRSGTLNTAPNEPPSDVNTMLRIMRIDNELIRNTLIINANAEQIAFTPNRDAAQDMVYGPRRIHNVKSAIAYGRDRSSGVRFEVTRTNNIKAISIASFSNKPRMRTDREAQIRAERQRVEAAKQAYNIADQACNDSRKAMLNAQQELIKFRTRRKNLKVAMQRAEDAVTQQETEINDNLPQDGRLQELDRQLAEKKNELQSIGLSFIDHTNSHDTLGVAGATLKKILDDTERKFQEAQQALEQAKSRHTKASDDRHSALLDKNEAVEAVEAVKRLRDRCLERMEEQMSTVQEFTDGASQISARVPLEDGITTDRLDERIAKLVKEYERSERNAGGTMEQLTASWMAAQKEFDTAQKQIEEMDSLHKTLTGSLAERQDRWRRFRDLIAANTRHNFGYLLGERSFRGDVKIDHVSKSLEIKVEPDMGKASKAGRETRTLSGGEKSFSTICLLLAIWEAMGSPIRCLDEFDVFMDSVNRQASMSLMIGAARRSVGKQYILITPQAMNNVTMGDDVRIYRMSDPERGQTTLSLEPVR